jgi:hypothetical protein
MLKKMLSFPVSHFSDCVGNCNNMFHHIIRVFQNICLVGVSMITFINMKRVIVSDSYSCGCRLLRVQPQLQRRRSCKNRIRSSTKVFSRFQLPLVGVAIDVSKCMSYLHLHENNIIHPDLKAGTPGRAGRPVTLGEHSYPMRAIGSYKIVSLSKIVHGWII